MSQPTTKVFVAGASGAIGKRLVPLLVGRGHAVVAMTRDPRKADGLRARGAAPVIADGLDRDAVMRAVLRAEPDVVVHEMTSLAGITNIKNFDDEFALTNRLRTEGTDHLLDAALTAGARRFVVQSFGNWNYERTGTGLKRETDRLDPDPPVQQRLSLAAIRQLETAVTAAADLDGVVLRYANLYGPGTGFASDGEIVPLLRKRRWPIVGDGDGIWSFVHVDDAAAATVAAVEDAAPGIYNVADDEPAPVSEWLPALARALGAKPPRHVPVWVGRLAVGDVGVSMMTRIRGASNTKARAALGWEPWYATWRDGFRHGLAEDLTRRGIAA